MASPGISSLTIPIKIYKAAQMIYRDHLYLMPATPLCGLSYTVTSSCFHGNITAYVFFIYSKVHAMVSIVTSATDGM
jgi:hypothetical protein